MRVRATRPNYWVGQTFDDWTGQDWVQSAYPVASTRSERVTGGSPFLIPTFPDQVASLSSGTQDIQTFYLAQGGPNLVFHADNAQRVYLQAHTLTVTPDGTITSGTSMGPGTIYTVVSDDTEATPAQLQAATSPAALTADPNAFEQLDQKRYLQLPNAYPRVKALAESITKGIGQPGGVDPYTYDKVAAIETWMSDHVRYTTDIPPLPAGADAVDSFLFGSRRGYCEQISTATVVMLRSIGIPAREAVGYVPGSYNPITDLYEVQAKDAHAWVQVWFPGYGWQNFDPTANVPLANPTPGTVLAGSIGRGLARLPWIPIGLVAGVAAVVWWVRVRRANRPATWAHQVAADLSRGGARLGLPRATHETLTAYGRRLGRAAPDGAGGLGAGESGAGEFGAGDLEAVTELVERSTYGGIEPTASQIADALEVTRRFRAVPKRRRDRADGRGGRDPGATSGGPGPAGPDQDAARARASSNDAPAASSGR